MQTINDVHQQFAEFFDSETIRPFAYLVSKKLAEGHICLDLKDVEEELAVNAFYKEHEVTADKLMMEPLVTSAAELKQPFVLHNNKLYLERYFNYETQILERIYSFVKEGRQKAQERMLEIESSAHLIRSLFDGSKERKKLGSQDNVDWQLVAAITGVLNDFTIITGGPGTGKTTTVAKILAILYTINPELKVALAAPTGKAAVRMSESLKSASRQVPAAINSRFESIIPGTIHRLLKVARDSPYFKHNEDNPVNYDVVIVDESSMIDAALFAKLLNAIGPETRLILLGDKDQLASVEAGSLFGDLCKSQTAFYLSAQRASLVNAFIPESFPRIGPHFILEDSGQLLFEHIVELKTSHRFSSDQGIGKFSKAVILGDERELEGFFENRDDQVTVDTSYDENIFENFIKGYQEYISEPDIKTALQKMNKLRVLCAVREGEQGLNALNRKIEKYLAQKKLIKTGIEFYEHRPVIVTRNYYDLNLFNGDVGIVRYDESHVLKAWFEDPSGEIKAILPGFIAEADTVFAMTIHKSQGSEYDQVLVVLPDAIDMPLLTAELLYTGVTRAKSKVVVQATEAVIMEASKRRVKRASGIVERLDGVPHLR